MFRVINNCKVHPFKNWTEASDFKKQYGGNMYCWVYSQVNKHQK